MGDLGEHVVHLVGANVVQDPVDPAVVAVNGAQLASNVVPLRVSVPGLF